jgi:tyrosine-protein kinase Etk/Wzc
MTEAQESISSSSHTHEAELPWLDFLILVSRGKRVVLVGTLGFALAALLIFLFVPKQYTATTTFLAPQQQSSLASALLSQVGGAGLLGSVASSGLGMKTSGDLYITLLKSRYVEDAILAQSNLQSVYHSRRLSDARRKLESLSTITTSKDGVVSVSVDDTDPKRAVEIADAYVQRLQLLTSQLAVTEAARRRQVFERQIEKSKFDLARAESDLNQMQKKTGLVQPDAQARSTILSLASLRAQIAAKQVQAGVLRSYETSQNPDLARVEQEVAGMQGQLGQLERKQNAGNGDIQLPTTAAPDVELEYLRRFREVKLQEALYEILMKQYEAAKIDEAREGSLVQVIDRAIEPDKKSFPKLGLITIGAGVLGFLLSLSLIVLRDARQRALRNPEIRARLLVLQRALTWSAGPDPPRQTL